MSVKPISIATQLLLKHVEASSVYNYANKLPIPTLVKILKELSEYYYNTSSPLVSDEIYDILRDILVEKNKNHKYLKDVGSTPKKDKVKLPYNLPSLSKIKPDTNILAKYLKNHTGPYIMSDKLDGGSALLVVKDGIISLYSRGDGEIGQDITKLVPYVVRNTDKIKDMTIAVRGELIISRANFAKIKNTYSNGRNAVNSHMTNTKVNKDLANITDFVAYSVINPKLLLSDQFILLEKLGFKTVNHKQTATLSNDMLSEYLVDRRKNSEYDVDGIVVGDSSKIYDDPTKALPTHMFAFKTMLTDQIAETTILDVEWSVSKHGYIKPRIRISPVSLVGVTITYATAYNAKFVYDNKLGPGAVIKIIRSGDVIPKILSVIKPAPNAKMPDIPYKWNDTKVDIILSDIHTQSLSVSIKRLTNLFKELGVMYLSEGIVTKLVENGYDDIVKILTADRLTLYDINGLGQKIVDKIYNNIDAAFKKADLVKLMAGSSIFGRGLGNRKIKLILTAYPNILNDNTIDSKMIENIIAIDGFDTKLATQFVNNLSEFKKWFNKINKVYDISYLNKFNKVIKDVSDKTKEISGKTIVFTGFRNKMMEEYIVAIGSKLSTNVSKNTDLVVYSDVTSAKYKNAIKLGIKTMTFDEFKDKYF